jgi:hypothetical protein
LAFVVRGKKKKIGSPLRGQENRGPKGKQTPMLKDVQTKRLSNGEQMKKRGRKGSEKKIGAGRQR